MYIFMYIYEYICLNTCVYIYVYIYMVKNVWVCILLIIDSNYNSDA